MKKINLFLVIAFCIFAIVGGLSQVFTINTAFAATSEDMVAIEDVVAEIFGDKSINSIEYLYNYDGNADYIYVNFENYGYAVFQTETFEVLEYTTVGDFPYTATNDELVYGGPRAYFSRNANHFVDVDINVEYIVILLQNEKPSVSHRQNNLIMYIEL